MKSPFLDEQEVELVTLIGIMIKKYGHAWIGWEVETLRLELLRDHPETDEVVFQKICAGQLLLAHDMAWREWEVFEKVCAACNHQIPDFSMVQPPESEEVLITMASMAKIGTHEYSREVKKYIAACCLHDGLCYPEGPLMIAKEFFSYHFEQTGFLMDYNKVEKLLLNRKKFDDAKNYAEVQVNRVLDCRDVLKDFMKELKRESEVYRRYLE